MNQVGIEEYLRSNELGKVEARGKRSRNLESGIETEGESESWKGTRMDRSNQVEPSGGPEP